MLTRILFIAGYCACAALAFAPQSVAQALPRKTPIEGLVDMQDISFYRTGAEPDFTLANVTKFHGQFGGIVLNATWQQLQPTQDGPLSTASVDTALAKVRAYNKQNGAHPLGIKLRVWGGFMAPGWAKNLAGGPVQIPILVHGTTQETVGRYWTASYKQAWQAFQSRLAARYDLEPLIREVAVTSCAWATDEPFVQWISPANGNINQNFTNLSQAGYTAAKEFECLQDSLSDYAGWKTTDLDFPFNLLQMYLPAKDTGTIRGCQHVTYGNFRFCSSEDLSKFAMIECWQSRRCVLSNQALAKSTGQDFPYDFIDTIYKIDSNVPIDFQTASPKFVSGMTGLCDAVTAARTYHARSVELWPSAFTSLTPQQIAVLDSVMDGHGPCDATASGNPRTR